MNTSDPSRSTFRAVGAQSSLRSGSIVAHYICVGFYLLLCITGCQVSSPNTAGLPSYLGTPHNSTFKPASDPTEKNETSSSVNGVQSSSPRLQTPQRSVSSTATIRGQSPNSWNLGTPGSDSYRTPMTASDSTVPRGVLVQQGGQQALPPPSSYTAPAAQGYATQPYGQPYTTNQPATQPYTTQPYAAGQPSDVPYTNGQAYGQAPLGQQPYSPSDLQPYNAPGYVAPPTVGYGAPSTYQDYGSAVAPGAFGGSSESIAPGVIPDTSGAATVPDFGSYRPRQRVSPLDVYLQEARTGRIMIGGSVNSNLGVAGQIVIDERNFDIRRFPRSWDDLWSGRAFRGRGQNFRAELMPGTQVSRYTVNWTERNLLGYLPYSLSVGGFYFTRLYRDWNEQRLGGRVALGYEITKDLTITGEMRLEDVKIFNPRVAGVQQLDRALGSNDLYTGRIRLAHDKRDNPFMSTEGHLFEIIYDQVFGEFDYPRAQVNFNRYFLVKEREDNGGRHTLASTWQLGISGSQTPIFENFFAGGYNTLRGFRFRGASPIENGVQVGGRLQLLGSLEYIFPLTADEMLRGVAFVDYGTIERDLSINSENIRVAPGLGLRVNVPALGPAPLAFDFAYPVNMADGDQRQIFSFFMGLTR